MRLIRTLTSGAAAAALALSTLLVLPQAAYAAEEYPVPSSGSWEVEGRGWGHGIGMSQWGAKAAAEQGLDHREILSFYYPGTEVGTVGNATIRVALQALQNQGTVAIWSPQGQTELRAGVPGQPPHVFRAGRLTVTYDRGQYQLHHQTPGGSVERVDLSGNELRVSTDGGVIVAGSPGATSATWYRGIVRLNPEGNAQMDVVNDLPLESYLRGVVPSEMPASWHTEALQAQAVAARSYVLRAGTTTCDTTQCQVYTGRARVNPTTRGVTTLEQPRSDAAIAATAGEIRTYQGGAAFTQFSSTNGGYSVAGSQPYLIAQPDPYTGTAQGDIRSRWTDRLEVSAVERHCPANGDLEQLVVVAR
ncbi:SpoIID/LytB domain-containing protein, partial [Georgenia sp. 10Sc9-8]|nr:SpoIID/LytB domain-containing protein [Georgenia halotolerans]